jgi:penicillin-binding protein 2
MMELNTQRMEEFRGRYKYFVLFAAVTFFLLLLSLWYLQVIKGSGYRQLSTNNCIRIRENPAARGMILDRKGRILAHNRPSFEVYVVPEDLKANPEVLIEVGHVLNMDQEEIERKLKTQKKRAPFRPVKIKSPFSKQIEFTSRASLWMSGRGELIISDRWLLISLVTSERLMKMN